MIRPERELIQIALHVFGADVNVGAAHRSFEQPPEALDVVRVVRLVGPVVVVRILLGTVLHGPVGVPVAAE